WEEPWPRPLQDFKFHLFTPHATRLDRKPQTEYDRERLKQFLETPTLNEDSNLLLSSKENHYYGAIRATRSCLACHQKDNPDLKEGGLIAVIKIPLSTELIEDGVHVNRSVLICVALVTALLIMGGSYLIVRYVIVKPVKHLKEVSDAISAGELN